MDNNNNNNNNNNNDHEQNKKLNALNFYILYEGSLRLEKGGKPMNYDKLKKECIEKWETLSKKEQQKFFDFIDN